MLALHKTEWQQNDIHEHCNSSNHNHYSQLLPCVRLAITDSSEIPSKSYRRLTESNSHYHRLLLLRIYRHFIQSQCHNFIVFLLAIVDTILEYLHTSLFFLIFEIVFVFLVDFHFFCTSIKIPSSFSLKALFVVSLP